MQLPWFAQKEGFPAPLTSKRDKTEAGKAILTCQLSRVRWDTEPNPSLPRCDGAQVASLAQEHQNSSFLREEKTFSKEIFFHLLKTPLKLTYVTVIFFFFWTNSHFKNRTLKRICQIIKKNNKQKNPIISPVSQLMFPLQLSAIST